MSDFWGLSDGDSVKAGASYQMEGGSMEPIPDGTQVLAALDEAKWDSKEDNEYISLRWSVLKPDTYKNRKVFQKLWVMGNNPNQSDPAKKKAQGDKAKRMLAAIDTNCGGKLLAGNGKPSDMDLQSALLSKPMVVKLAVWEMTDATGGKMNGNWVQGVSAKENGVTEVKPQVKAADPVDEDSIPF
jgi:hypothetical protein